MTLRSRRGSRWMSEARWSKAYCQSQSTTWMTPRVVGVELLGALAELDQLLEVGERRALAHLGGVAHRARERIELGGVAGDLDRIDDHQADAPLGVRLDLRDPGRVERLAGRDRHVVDAEGERQRMAPLGIVDRHHVGDAADVDLERIDADVGQLAALGQPLGQGLDVEHLAVAETGEAGAADPHQRMLGAVAAGEAVRGAVDVLGAHDLVFAQPGEHGAPGELAGGLHRRQGRGRWREARGRGTRRRDRRAPSAARRPPRRSRSRPDRAARFWSSISCGRQLG